jgi:hypothetical protein
LIFCPDKFAKHPAFAAYIWRYGETFLRDLKTLIEKANNDAEENNYSPDPNEADDTLFAKQGLDSEVVLSRVAAIVNDDDEDDNVDDGRSSEQN